MINRSAFAGAIFALAAFGLGAAVANAQSPTSAPEAPPTATAAKPELPPYHDSAPKSPLPATRDPHEFPEVENQNLYALAAKEKAMLYQEPCFCHCNREVGHESLLDCFVDTHAANCLLCKKEAVLTYQEWKQGKTAAQIRQDIVEGKWKTIDLSKYDDEVIVTPNSPDKQHSK
ncbi:MAG: PCYCGC motif-containing (lipo)protein [Candidatus Acidiferrales bacterium]